MTNGHYVEEELRVYLTACVASMKSRMFFSCRITSSPHGLDRSPTYHRHAVALIV